MTHHLRALVVVVSLALATCLDPKEQGASAGPPRVLPVGDVPTDTRHRIAVAGGSGGGTRTFMLSAVDDRPLVSVPVVIVSTTRQGGCTCENISGLRIGTYNLEFTAPHAPKPLLLISADDATRTMPERGARAAIDTSGFRFAQLTDVYDAGFLPGAAKYGDLPGLLALAAPARL
jgi:hypothetical protein